MSVARIRVRVQPRARASEVVGWEGDVLRVRIQAPPLEEQANRDLVALLAQHLDLPHREIAVVRGAHSRNKVIAIEGLTQGEVRERLRGSQP